MQQSFDVGTMRAEKFSVDVNKSAWDAFVYRLALRMWFLPHSQREARYHAEPRASGLRKKRAWHVGQFISNRQDLSALHGTT